MKARSDSHLRLAIWIGLQLTGILAQDRGRGLKGKIRSRCEDCKSKYRLRISIFLYYHEERYPGGGLRMRRCKMRVWHCLTNRRDFGFVSAASLLALLSVTGASQEKNQPQPRRPQQEPPAVLKVTTRLVTVDVVARDRHGNPVRDLKPSDFQLTEQAGSHKTPQQIASFRLLDRSLTQAPDLERATLQLPAGVFTNLVTTKSLSAPPTILLGRELRLLQSFTTDAKLLRAAAERALTLEATNLQAKDARDDTFSHSSLLEQMAGAEGQSDMPGGPPSAQPGGQGSSGGGNSNALLAMRALQLQRFEREQYADSMDIRARMTLDALRVIARHVSGYPGRKNLIGFRPPFLSPLRRMQTSPWLRGSVDCAITAMI